MDAALNSNTTNLSYDVLDRLSSVKDATGRTAGLGYDALSRQISVSNLAIQSSPLLQKSYSADGRPASLTDANNNTTSFAYDRFDRLATTTYPLGSTETLTYDADSNVLTRKTRASQTITFTYDTLNRLATKTPPSPAAVVSYTYDLAGRIKGVSDSSSSITAAVPPSGSSAQYATNLTYDALNRPTGITWNPASTPAAPSASSITFGHSYNKVNQRIGQTATDNSWLSYPAATPSTVSYTANALNQYTAVGAVTPSYDGNGNLTSDGTFTFGYDAENRLTSAIGAGNTASYTYDAQGRRKTKTVNGTTTVFVTDAGNREVLEYDGASGAIQRWYAYGLGSNDVLNQMNVTAGTRAALIPDIQGSVIASLDSSSGTLSKTGYLPYGKSASATASFGYTGQRIDSETNGLYYFRARHYSPTWGRFLQADPIGYGGGNHLYAYVNNDPLNQMDPTGLDTWSLGLNVNAFFGGGGSSTIGFYYNTDTGRFGTFLTVGGGGGLDVSANIVLQNTFGGPENFFGTQLGSGFAGSRGPVGGGPTYDAQFNPNQLSSYTKPSGFQVSVGVSGVEAVTGIPFAASVQQSTTYETTGAVTAALAGDIDAANQIGPAEPIPGVSNQFILGPNGPAK
jgi:RHS repeat-associated protein